MLGTRAIPIVSVKAIQVAAHAMLPWTWGVATAFPAVSVVLAPFCGKQSSVFFLRRQMRQAVGAQSGKLVQSFPVSVVILLLHERYNLVSLSNEFTTLGKS